MPAYRPEPPFDHTHSARIGILLINLGSPQAPTARALRPYLREFLSDRRVVEMPRALWWPILNGVILTTRPRKSAEKYAQIWTPDGPPLKLHTERQAKLLRGYLGERLKAPHVVEYAMRYGAPSIAGVLSKLKKQGCDRILVLPLYPQYAASSTGTAFDAVFRALQRMRNVPALRTVRHYHDHPGYIQALTQNVHEHWTQTGRPERLVISFHGVPRATLDKGDPYHCQCLKTGRLLAQALGLDQDGYRICFQSRFGPARWLKPYTAATLESLGKQGVGRVDVICPGFAGDCLETLEEIAITGKALFLKAGGKEFHYIPALNERDDWIHALSDIALENLRGWESEDAGAPQERHARALAAGAKA